MVASTFFFGLGYPGMMEFERLMDASLADAEGMAKWAERDPVLNIHKVQAPLKIETYGSRSALLWWDTYAWMRRLGKPVEYIYYPYGTHNLVKPRERERSMQGAVDWYRFWLLGEEDDSPSKTEQYRRWREMKSTEQ